MSTPTPAQPGTARTTSTGWASSLGFSTSQAVVRLVLLGASVALVALTLVAAPQGSLVAAVVSVALAGWATARPESVGTNLLVAALALHWVITVPAGTSLSRWLMLLAAAWLLLVVHLSAALAASLPPGAPVPGPSLRRWGRRGAVVAAATVPLWALALTAGRQTVPGEVALTYAAIVATAVLALAVWLFSRETHS